MRMGGFQALELKTSKAELRSQSTQRPSLTPRGSSRTPYANSRILHYASAYGPAKVHTSCCHSLCPNDRSVCKVRAISPCTYGGRVRGRLSRLASLPAALER